MKILQLLRELGIRVCLSRIWNVSQISGCFSLDLGLGLIRWGKSWFICVGMKEKG